MKVSTFSRYGQPYSCLHATLTKCQVFVANPKKSVAVQKILLNNRERLLRFLPVFLADRTDDDQFTDEKSFLIRQIETMPSNPTEPA